MEDEFRIRKEIIARAEGSGTEKSGRSKADDEIRFRTGEVVDGNGATPADANQYARFDSGIAENSGNMERPLGYAGGTVGAADSTNRADGTDPDGVSGDASGASGADSSVDLDLNGDLPITGWESERELLTATLIGGTGGEPPQALTGLRFLPRNDSNNRYADHLFLSNSSVSLRLSAAYSSVNCSRFTHEIFPMLLRTVSPAF